MKRYRIVPKRDFGMGFWLPGVPGGVGTLSFGYVKSGFIVTDGTCNIMPGATWFRTVEDAMEALSFLIEVNFDSASFWKKMPNCCS